MLVIAPVTLLSCSSGGETFEEADPPAFEGSISSFCSEKEILSSTRTGSGPGPSIEYLRQRYPAPPIEYMIQFNPKQDVFLHEYSDGSRAYIADFKIRAFKPTYLPGEDSIFEEIRMTESARLVVPLVDDLRTDALLFSINRGTSNGLPPPDNWDLTRPDKHDPARSAQNTPEWFKGTLTGNQYKETYSSIAYQMKVPFLFHNIVPDKIVFQRETENRLRELKGLLTPNYTCDELECELGLNPQGEPARGAWEDGAINHCLSHLGYLDPQNPELFNFHAGSFYALAIDRAIDATEIVLNRMSEADQRFDLENVITIGGSKRGIASRHALAGLSRVKAALSGHANAGNFHFTMQQRENLYRFEPENFYEGSEDNLEFFKDLELWRSSFELHDPAYWKPEVWRNKKLLVTWGTNDTYFHTGAELSYSDALPKNTSYLSVVNYPHGGGTVDHAVAFRSLVNESLNQVEMPQLEAKWDYETNKISATLVGPSPDKVELWCSHQLTERDIIPLRSDINTCESVGTDFKMPPPDLRYSHFKKVNMLEESSKTYTATPLEILDDGAFSVYRACFVRASKGKDDYVVTSKTLLNRQLCAESLLKSQIED